MGAFIPHSTLSTKIVASATAFPATTSAPLYRRAETTAPSTVIGFTSTFGLYSPWNCLTGTWYAVESYGRCCPTTGDCPVYTTCREDNIIANEDFMSACSGISSQTICVTGTVYESIGDVKPRYYVGCWPSWTGGDWQATRQVPATYIENTTTTSIPITSSSSTGGSSSATFPKGTLAALILGLVVLVALSVGLSFLASCLWTRRKKKRAKVAAEAGFDIAPVQSNPPVEFQRYVRAVGDQVVQPLRPQSRPAEMDASSGIGGGFAAQVVASQPSPIQGAGTQTTESDSGPSSSRHSRRASELGGKEVPTLLGREEKLIRRPPNEAEYGQEIEVKQRYEEEEEASNTTVPRNDNARRDVHEEENVVDLSNEPGPSNTPQTENGHTVVSEAMIGNGKLAVRQ